MRGRDAPNKGEIIIIKRICLLWVLAALVFALLTGLTGCAGKEPASSAPEPEPAPPAWWELLSWEQPRQTFTGKNITARVYDSGRASFTLDIPAQGDCDLRVYTGYGRVDTLFLRNGVWSGAKELGARADGNGLTLMLRDGDWDLEEITALKTLIRTEDGTTEAFYRRNLEEDEETDESGEPEEPKTEGPEELIFRPSSLPDFSLQSPKFRYVKLDSEEEWVVLALYRDDTFLLSAKENGVVFPLIWGKWDDGNTAITFWPDEQCCGPDTTFRLEKTGGLRVYEGGGPPSLPLAENDAFLKVGDMLDFPAFDAAVVSMVVDGDRPALFLDREGKDEGGVEVEAGSSVEVGSDDGSQVGSETAAKVVSMSDEELLDAFREMMLDAVELSNPRWTEDPEDRPNIQFDLNINGEDITMVLCPCIVADTEDKYLLVQKDSYMGRVTYTYYQTRQGDDYDRMCELFDTRYEEDPQVLTAAMAAQTRAQTAAISNLDWSDEFPLDENGIPIEYNYVLREQRATGYWRSGQVWGAGSRACEARTGIYYCTAGTVAVRASQIPYGTKMYIRTPGGGFIYGYAVANDTGTGLEEGLIDIDLFYDSYQESVLNSVRWVDVYILD